MPTPSLPSSWSWAIPARGRHPPNSDEAAGGVGIGKAVIQGIASSFHLELYTRDNLAVSNDPDSEVEIFAVTSYLQGYRITVFGLAPDLPSDSCRKWTTKKRTTASNCSRGGTGVVTTDLRGGCEVLETFWWVDL
jgi:hypothetical protein